MSFLRDLRQARLGLPNASPNAPGWSTAAWRAARKAWHWWYTELAACIPQAITHRLFGEGQVVELRLDGDIVHVPGHGKIILEAPALPAGLRRKLRQADTLALILPKFMVLRRVIDVPDTAAREISKAIPFLVERHTPFLPGHAHVAWRTKIRPVSGRAGIELAATAARPLDRVTYRLSQLGIPISRVHVDGDTRTPRLDFAAARTGVGRRWLTEPWRACLAATALLLVAGPPAVSIAVHHRAASLAAAAGAPPQDVARLRMAIGRASASAAVLAGRLAKPDPLAVLNDVTQALPDSTWLFSFDLTPDTLEIAGFSTDLPASIARLQALPDVARLEFRSPVIHDARADRDRFDILLHLRNLQNAH